MQKNEEELKVKIVLKLESNPSRHLQKVGNVDAEEDIRMHY